ncbi:MAG: dienelactone hydrolase family protein [Lewinellaceae bacterium]|nr:dienelactone hydrolase family protein [Lewinellaceae bacterium]
MTRLLFTLSVLVLLATSCGEKTATKAAQTSCCGDPNAANATFVSFSDDAAFRDMHPAPKPTELTKKGKMVKFTVAGGAAGSAFLVRPKRRTDQYLLLFHEWWGLNDYIRNEAAMWSEKLGVNVLAVDLYDGKVATTADEAGKLMQGCNPERALAIIKGAAAYAGPKADFRTMGWCFGGGWSMQAAIALSNRVKACVMYYGMPETDVERLKGLMTDVVFIHAKQDKWINDEVVAKLQVNMKLLGKKVMVYDYDADHAFANPSNPKYNDAAASEARAVVEAYLKEK